MNYKFSYLLFYHMKVVFLKEMTRHLFIWWKSRRILTFGPLRLTSSPRDRVRLANKARPAIEQLEIYTGQKRDQI